MNYYKFSVLLLALAIGGASSSAQKVTTPCAEIDFTVIPATFTSEGATQFVTSSADDGTTTATILDKAFQTGKTISKDTDEGVLRRAVEMCDTVAGEYTDSLTSSATQLVSVTLADLKAHETWKKLFNTKQYTETLSDDGKTHTFKPAKGYYAFSTFVGYAYSETDKSLDRNTYWRSPQYDESSWQQLQADYESPATLFHHFAYLTADGTRGDLSLTQTLFNSDDKYEYAELEYTTAATGYTDLTNKRTELWKRQTTYAATGVKTHVKTDDGSTLYTLPGLLGGVVVADNTKYALVYTTDGYLSIYELTGADPTFINKVKADTSALNRERLVTITAIDGRSVARYTVPAGERALPVSTARLTPGQIYHVGVTADGQQVESTKILVK